MADRASSRFGYEDIFLHSPIGMCIIDLDLKHVRINQALADINGISIDMHYGKTYNEICPEIAHQLDHLLRLVLAIGDPIVDVTVQVSLKDLPYEEKFWLFNLYPYKSNGIDVDGVSVIVQNLANLKKARRELEVSKAEFQDFYDNSPEMFLSVGPRGTIIKCNKTTVERLGYNKNEIIGTDIRDLYHPRSHEVLDEYLQTFESTGVVKNKEIQIQCKDGTAVDILLNITALRDDQGDIVLSRNVWSDISAVVVYKKQLDILKRSKKELVDLATVLTHDVKGPLRGIRNQAESLKTEFSSSINSDGFERLKRIGSLTSWLEEMIHMMAEFTKLGQIELQKSEENINSLVEEASNLIKDDYGASDLKIVLTRNFPSINCDGRLIKDVFVNLMSNAIKFNDNQIKNIEIGMQDAADSNVFYVKDNGIGISESKYDAIFEIYKRLHEPDEYGGGTGAGLTYVKKIIERHGGKIWVVSQRGLGATFFFTLNEKKKVLF